MTQNYKSQLPMDDPKFTNYLLELIEEMIDKKLKKAPFTYSKMAKVINVGTGVADIQILNSTNTITGVKLRKGLTVSVNNIVWVTFINNSNVNFFIDDVK